ncbi:MAG: hypothetical protein ACN6PV_15215 [Achromobacter sp.]|uniref:hypothetical protein n=1 Tax=Achromobacter sp. TaxID=134375 RepID=UPI003D042A30
MKGQKLLLGAALVILPWQAPMAQTSQTTRVAQAAPPPSMPVPTADDKMAPPNVIREPVTGTQSADDKKKPATEATTDTPKPHSEGSKAPPKNDASGVPDSRRKRNLPIPRRASLRRTGRLDALKFQVLFRFL